MHPISLFLAANTVSPKYGMDISCPEILTQRDTEETSVDNEMKRRAVSEVIGTVILVGVVMIGIVLVGLLLLSNPAPTKVPAFDSLISNRSKTIYIYHKGGDPLFAGQYKVFVDGVDQTGSFAIMSPGSEPWSVGETLAATLSTMPRHVVLLLTQAGGGGTVISESDLSPILIVPLHPTTPPSVAWSSSPAFGNATTLFQFTDSSTGEYISSFYWNFNDANTSTTQSPAHAFPCNTGESCVYSINHSVTNSGGSPWEATSWLNRSAWVTVYKNLTPTVTFTQDTTSGNPPLTVTFTATQAGAIKVDTWYWSFGDSGSSTSQNPSHTYVSPGYYTVSLTATNYSLGVTTVTKASLIAITPSPAWYCGWLYRKNITLDKTRISGSLTNFPVLIGYTDSDLSARALANGDDILFTDSTGTAKIPHQIESYTSGTGALTAWVNVPSLSSAANTTIYMYYGNSGASSQQNPTGVWDSDFKGVYHLNESTGSNAGDSTSNSYTGTQSGSPTQTAGKIDGSLSFSGSNSVSMGDVAAFDFGTNPFTASAWVKGGGTYQQVLGKSAWTGGDNGIQVFTNASGTYVSAANVDAGITATGSTSYPTYTAGTTSTQATSRTTRNTVSWYRQTGTIKGTVTSIKIYIAASAGNVQVAMYADQGLGSKPGSKLLESGFVAAGTAGTWQTISVPATYVDTSAWWIAIEASSNSFNYRTNSDSSTNWYAYQSVSSPYAFPSSGSGATLSTSRSLVSAYVTYVQVKNYAKATKVTIPVDAIIYSISFYSHATGNARLAIYSDSSGPSSLLWESGSSAVSASSWYSLVNLASGGNPVALNAGTYWLAWQWDSVNAGPSYTAGSGGDGNYLARTYGAFPSTWSGGTSSAEKWSMYVTYRSVKIGANDGNWHYLAVARAGTGAGQLTTYYDGAPVVTSTDSRTLSNADSFKLAISNDNLNGFTGYLDEVRLSSTARSAGWIATEYNNQANPALFHYNMNQEAWTCTGPTGVNLQVAASTDDCYRWSVNGFDCTTSNDFVDTINGGSGASTGLRFNGVTVPQGATITTAYLTYRARFTGATPGGGTIRGQNADNALTFTDWSNYDGRPRTTASVHWTPSAWVADTDYTSPELKTVIQEIVNRPGWTSGNAMAFFVVVDFTSGAQSAAYPYDVSSTYAPKLHIEYA